MHKSLNFQFLLQDYFSNFLINQKRVSPQTVSSYRDSMKIFLLYCRDTLKIDPSDLKLSDLDVKLVLGFLDFLERERGNSVKSRNARLSALRSFFKYVSFKSPDHAEVVQQILSIPKKKSDNLMMGYLFKDQIDLLLQSIDQSTWSGQRDFALFSFMYNTGARISEAISLRKSDLVLKGNGFVDLRGKGRKQRQIPLWKTTKKLLSSWLNTPQLQDTDYVFPNKKGTALSRTAVESRLQIAVKKACLSDKTLLKKKVSPHTIRHTTAMHMLQSGVDITVIALWLGHSDIKTTHIYVEADLKMKETALQKVQEPDAKWTRYKATDQTLSFLNSL